MLREIVQMSKRLDRVLGVLTCGDTNDYEQPQL